MSADRIEHVCPLQGPCHSPARCRAEGECINSTGALPLRRADGTLAYGVVDAAFDPVKDVINELTAPPPFKLVPKREQGIPQLLEVVDDLREKIASGQIVAFAAVGIEADDVTMSWQGCTQGVTNLRLVGAVARLMHGVHTDIDS